MKLSIYEVYVNIEGQPQADRMKQICIDYGLPYWDDEIAFIHDYNVAGLRSTTSVFCYSKSNKEFAVYSELPNIRPLETQVTEAEFLKLVENFANSK